MNKMDNAKGVPSAAPEDQRDAPRFALMLRTAKLVGDHGEYLCIVRDVSESGLKLRLFHPLPDEQHFSLENATGERFEVERVWEREGEAGLRFIHSVDVSRFIAEAGPFPKRPIRLRLRHEASLAVAGNGMPVTLVDISREGARIEAEQHLALAQQVRIESTALPPLDATVCWRRHPAYGLVFRQVLTLSDLAQRSLQMQGDSPSSSGRG